MLAAARLIPAGPSAEATAEAPTGLVPATPGPTAAQVVRHGNRPGELIVMADLSGSRYDIAGVAGALVHGLSSTSAAAPVERVLVGVAEHHNPPVAGPGIAIDAELLARIRAAAAQADGIEAAADPVLDFVADRGWRALIAAAPEAGASDGALQACATRVGESVPELAQVVVCREVGRPT